MASARVLTTNELGMIRYQHALVTNSWPIEVRLLPQPNDTDHTLYTLHTPGNGPVAFGPTRREELRATLAVRPGPLVYEVLRDGLLVSTGGLEVRPPLCTPSSTSMSEVRPSGARQIRVGQVAHHNVIFEYNEMPWSVREVSVVDDISGRVVADLIRDTESDGGFIGSCFLPPGVLMYRFRVVLLSQSAKPTRLGWDDGAMTQAWELMTWPLCITVNDMSLTGATLGDGMMRLDESLLAVSMGGRDENDDSDDFEDDDDDETMVDDDEEQDEHEHHELDSQIELEEKENLKQKHVQTNENQCSPHSHTSRINSPVSSASSNKMGILHGVTTSSPQAPPLSLHDAAHRYDDGAVGGAGSEQGVSGDDVSGWHGLGCSAKGHDEISDCKPTSSQRSVQHGATPDSEIGTVGNTMDLEILENTQTILQNDTDGMTSSSSRASPPIKVSSRGGASKTKGRRKGRGRWPGMALNAAMFLLGTTVTLMMGRRRGRGSPGSEFGDDDEDDECDEVDDMGKNSGEKSKRMSSFNSTASSVESTSLHWGRRRDRRESDVYSVNGGRSG